MRIKQLIKLMLVLLCAALSISAQNLKSDLQLFTSWFEGQFDNHQQVFEEKETKAEFPHEHIHSIFARINAPQIAPDVFFVKQYTDGNPNKVYRQRVYKFSVNKKEKAIQLDIYTLDDEKKFADLHLDVAKQATITAANLKSPAGCEVYWRLNKTRDKFEGAMKKDACRVVSQRSGKTIIINDDLFLTQNEIWINDQAKDEQGNYVFGNKANVHHKLKRIRTFTGWVAIKREGGEEWETTLRDISIHDQGQIVKVSEKYSLQIAQLRFQQQVPVLVLRVVDNVTGKWISYSWTNPEAERVGINIGWLQSGFTLKK
jgi:hypothetical protein